MSADADPNWELRLISVGWTSKHTFTVLAEADSPVSVTRNSAALWSALVPTFPQVGQRPGQLAIRSDAAPELILADGSQRPFKQLEGTRWWIEKCKFVSETDGPYWKSTLNAKAGHAVIRIAEETIRLTLLPSDWSWEQVLELERDLRTLALGLVTDHKSSAHLDVQQERRRARFEQVSESAKRLRAAADQILHRPITALTSSVRPVARHRARPCTTGIIDAASRPGRRIIRARVTEETVDVPENRYLVYMLGRVRSLLRFCHLSTAEEGKAQLARSADLSGEIAGMPVSAPESVKITPKGLDLEQEVLERHLADIGRWNVTARQLFETWVRDRPDVKNPQRYLETVAKNKLKNLERCRAKFAAAGWTRPTTVAERNEYAARLSALKTQADISSRIALQRQGVARKLALLDQTIRESFARWRGLGVPPSPVIPTSVAMHRRTAYARAVTAYRDLMREFGDETTADLLLQAPEGIVVGLVDLWMLFERWCLVQLVDAACGVFAVGDIDLRERVVRAALTKCDDRSSNEIIHFARKRLTCSIELEPSLQTISGRDPKHPDFRIEIHGGLNDVVAILDAKCKQYRESLGPAEDQSVACSLPSLSGEIKAMYFGPETPGGERNYSMYGTNRVFVLHPSVSAVRTYNPAQAWTRNTYYGERAAYDWQAGVSPNHQYGAVYMRPRSSRDLQKLLMLLVYAAVLPPFRGEIAASMQDIAPCATCGGTLVWEDQGVTEGRLPKYAATCSACREYHLFTHCVLCGQRLIKAGWHATYHSLAGQIGNIHCPNCQIGL